MRSARCLSNAVRVYSQCTAPGPLSRTCRVPGATTQLVVAASQQQPVLLPLQQRPFSDRPGKKQPKAKKKKPMGKGGETSGRSKELELILASLDAPSRTEGPIPAEERERRHAIGRNYVIGRFREHNEMDHDLTCKMHLKRHAIDMLKHHPRLHAEALKIDDDQVAPLWRHMPVWTPPIPGFDPSQFIDKDDK